MFEAIILAGGFGTRLKEISKEVPKPMVPVGGLPFVYHIMKKLELAGCSKIILSLHYNSEFFIRNILADKPVSCEIKFVVEDRPLGTGGALKLASRHVSDDFFLAMNGDTISDVDYLSLVHSRGMAELLIAAVKIENANRYGCLVFDSNMTLLEMNKKGIVGPSVINSGTYLIKTSQLLDVKEDVFSFEDFYIPTYKPKTKLVVFQGYFIDIGIPRDYFLACEKFA